MSDGAWRSFLTLVDELYGSPSDILRALATTVYDDIDAFIEAVLAEWVDRAPRRTAEAFGFEYVPDREFWTAMGARLRAEGEAFARAFDVKDLWKGDWEPSSAWTDPQASQYTDWVLGTEELTAIIDGRRWFAYLHSLVRTDIAERWAENPGLEEWEGSVIGPCACTLEMDTSDVEGMPTVRFEVLPRRAGIERTERVDPSRGLRPRRGEPARPWRCHGHPIHATAPPWPFGAA